MNLNSLTHNRRQEVAKHYCRTMVVIDDEVFDKDGRTISELFFTILQSCQKDNILCHFYQYPIEPDSNAAREANKQAVELAVSADVVILDWHLGTGTPEHCMEILDLMLQRPRSFRYIVIYTSLELASVDEILKSKIHNLENIMQANVDETPKMDIGSGDEDYEDTEPIIADVSDTENVDISIDAGRQDGQVQISGVNSLPGFCLLTRLS